MSLQAFGPRGSTCNISANATASAAVQVSAQGQSCYTYQFINSGNGKCWFAYGQQPNLTVTIPVPGTPAAAIPILPNEIVIYNLVPNAFFSVICGSGDTTTLEITPGEGM